MPLYLKAAKYSKYIKQWAVDVSFKEIIRQKYEPSLN